MNSVNVIGRLTDEPKLIEREGTRICEMRIAVNGVTKSDVLYIDVAAFNGTALACSQHLGKGRQVAIEGRLRYSQWEAQDGTKRSKHSLVANRVDFLGPKPAEQPTPATTDAESAEPVGFEQ